MLSAALPPVRSQLGRAGAGSLLLSAVALRLATRPRTLRDVLSCSLLPASVTPECLDDLCNETMRSLLKTGALEFLGNKQPADDDDIIGKCSDWELIVSALGKAAIKGCLELDVARRFSDDVRVVSRSLVLVGSLHLIYLVTPHEPGLTLDYRHYYSLYCSLDDEGLQCAKVLGITESNAVRMITGRPITNISQTVLKRFYAALIIRDLWKLVPLPQVADKYNVGRGWIQSLMTSCSSLAASGERVCEQLAEHEGGPFASFQLLLRELAGRLRHCAHPEIEALMELPAVRKARAMQLFRSGFRSVAEVARASPQQLAGAVQHLSLAAAEHLISAARMMLIEKVENLRAEAEDVMEGLQV
ncbi:helicase POLQ-like [Leptidea sinapis]|uniref:helicase POLQ-like n=1 Tax=Leptidea sinapis TaxID=189913 RepID=UPI0021C4729E|nr:helicase POLQ-like [Leptidea sinapis]